MIRLTYSNRSEALLDALVRRLAEARRDPLAPTWIVVPNRNVERFVELGVARRLGVAANLRFTRLARLLEELLDGPLLSGDPLRARVLRALLDEALLDAAPFGPVRRYLRAAGDAPAATEPRRAQLALHVAALFEEYGFSRPELLDAWAAGEARFAGTPHAATEAWQAALHRRILEAPWAGAPRTLRAGFAALDEAPFYALYVFGLSYVARVFAELFSALSAQADVSLFVLNPCEEFWEDVETESELRRRRRRGQGTEPSWLFEDEDPFGLSVDTDTPLLRRWGRPGREHVRLLDALTGCDFEAAFVDPLGEEAGPGEDALPLLARIERPPLLHRIQHDVLTRAPRVRDPVPAPSDDSVVVLGCPSLRREVETVAAEIWRALERADDLSFDQIAVLVNGPDADAYLPHIEAVFTAARRIPFNVTDLSLAAVSPIVDGALRLLALPTERFARPEVLAVLTHPAVLAGVGDVAPQDWIGLVDRLGVFWGIDREDLEGTYVADADRVSFEQGITRVALGAWCAGDDEGEPRPVTIDGHRYLPEEAPVGSTTEARFALLARSLSSDVRFARGASLSLREWARFCVAMLQAYLTPSDAREEGALRRVLAVAEGLADLDLDGAPVRWPVALELLRGPLEELAGTRGQHLADGVVVSSLVPMRAIPFRVIFVLGLGEGRFPAADRRDSMDLRAARRQAGDVTPPERDRYTFLETLLSARDRLVLTYVARDEQTGDPLAPSAVVAELLDVIEEGYLPGARGALHRTDVPLRRHEDEAQREVLEEAGAEHRARRFGRQLRDARGGELPRRLVPPDAARSVARDREVEGLLGLAPLPRGARSRERAPTVRLSIAALRRFLECPLQGWTRAVLRLEGDDPSAEASAGEEPFAPSRLQETIVLRSSFADAVLAGEPVAEVYARRVDAAIARGQWPLGPVAALVAHDHAQVLQAWAERFEALRAEAPRRLRVGAALSSRGGVQARDAIVLSFDDDPRDPGSGRPLAVELVGATELLIDGASVSLLLRHRGGSRGRIEELRHGLRAFFDQAVLAALGEGGGPHASVQLYPDRDAPVRHGCAPLSAADARAWLGELARDLLGGAHPYLFPIDAVLRLADRFDEADGDALVASVEHVRERGGGGQARWGPVRDAVTRAAPEPGRAEAMAERRFGPWLRRLGADGSGGRPRPHRASPPAGGSR